jgi:FMN phosphatase YigB (HAD superfamily)
MQARAAYQRTGRQTGWDTILADAASQASVALPDVESVVAALWESVPDGQVDPAAAAVVRRLRQHGYALILACNTQRPLAVRRRTLADAGLDDCFSSLVLSSVVGVGKPDPRFYEAVAEAAHGSAGCGRDGIVFVGDTPGNDAAGPLRSGMSAVLVAGPLTLGHLPCDVPVIPNLADLPGLLGQHRG